MAGVYRARHLGLDRNVALKVLHPDGANDIAALEWLHREARSLARLKHPGVLQVHDLGISDDGRPFVALEYVDGPDLQTLVDDEAPLSVARAVRLAAATCEALAAVHAAGIVHRDVKPENIALVDPWTPGETTMLLDFGIAIGPDDPPLTGEGMTVGTPGFVAPEQAMGEVVDGRADQYGLAMVLYQLLTGRHPYRKGDVLETLEAQLSKPVTPPARLRPGLISEALSGVVLRALALEPEDRYPDMLGFRAALLDAIGAPTEVHPPSHRPVSMAPVATPAVAPDADQRAALWRVDGGPQVGIEPPGASALAPTPEGWTPSPGRAFLRGAALLVVASVAGLLAGRWTAPAAPPGASVAAPAPPAPRAAEPPGVTPPMWTPPPASWPDDVAAACLGPAPLDGCEVPPARTLDRLAVDLEPESIRAAEPEPTPAAELEPAPRPEPPRERRGRAAESEPDRRSAPETARAAAAAPIEAQDEPATPPPIEPADDAEDAPPEPPRAVGTSELLLEDGPLVDQDLVVPR